MEVCLASPPPRPPQPRGWPRRGRASRSPSLHLYWQSPSSPPRRSRAAFRYVSILCTPLRMVFSVALQSVDWACSWHLSAALRTRRRTASAGHGGRAIRSAQPRRDPPVPRARAPPSRRAPWAAARAPRSRDASPTPAPPHPAGRRALAAVPARPREAAPLCACACVRARGVREAGRCERATGSPRPPGGAAGAGGLRPGRSG